jgi:hypothetical protein
MFHWEGELEMIHGTASPQERGNVEGRQVDWGGECALRKRPSRVEVVDERKKREMGGCH